MDPASHYLTNPPGENASCLFPCFCPAVAVVLMLDGSLVQEKSGFSPGTTLWSLWPMVSDAREGLHLPKEYFPAKESGF